MIFSFEKAFQAGVSHINSMVSPEGYTYFDVFRTSPAEAVMDWPDFVDLPARYLEAAVMLRPFGSCPCEKNLRDWLWKHIAEDGLAYRPDSPISRPDAELFDQSRLLYTLVSCLQKTPGDAVVEKALRGLCDGLIKISTRDGDISYISQIGVYYGGTLIRPLAQAGFLLREKRYLVFARRLAKGILSSEEYFGADGSFKGHVHGHMATVAGFIVLALHDQDDAMLKRAVGIFDYAKSISTQHGFVPELAQREDALVACETCALMDYLDVALLLARYVDAGMWSLVEKATRNHLARSQVGDTSWLDCNDAAENEEGILRRNLNSSLVGSFAGWSAPHALLAYEEVFWPEWVRTEEMKPRYMNKVRAIQNCCAGGGLRALHQVWSNVVTKEGGGLNVNLLFSKETKDVRVESALPADAHVKITLKKPAAFLRVRIPDRCRVDSLALSLNGEPCHSTKIVHGFIEMHSPAAGDVIELSLELLTEVETFSLSNPGHQSYQFEADWLGETVTEIRTDPGNPTSGYSRILKAPVLVFYGMDAPGMMYGHVPPPAFTESPPAPAMDDGIIDWYSLDALR